MVIKNSKRSGGPKTTEGKFAVSQNALKTGAYSNLAVLPSEKPEEFNQLFDQFSHDFRPADMIESSLVRELAVLTWKKLRLEKLEQAVFVKKLNAPINMEELIDCGLKFDKEKFNFWESGKTFSEDEKEIAKNTLKMIKPLQRVGISEDQLIQINNINTKVRLCIVDYYRRVIPMALPDITDWDLVSQTVRLPNQPERFLTSIVFEQFINGLEAALWVIDKQVKIEEAIVQIKQERLLNMIQSDNVRRANDDLSRSLMRTLTEFRKHHEWRIKNHLVDANEERGTK